MAEENKNIPAEEPVIEEVESDEEHDHDHEHDHENSKTETQKPKPTRNEKKARKAVLAHDMTPVEGIDRLTMKRDEEVYYFIERPDVYKSNTSDVYVAFGAIKGDNVGANNFAQQAAAQQFQAPEEAEEAPATEEPITEEVVDETGLNPDDIAFVIEQTKCTRVAAVKALRDSDNDMINAVMALQQ